MAAFKPSHIKIVSPPDTIFAQGTEVFLNGKKLDNVTAIKWEASVGNAAKATIEIIATVEIDGQAVVSVEGEHGA